MQICNYIFFQPQLLPYEISSKDPKNIEQPQKRKIPKEESDYNYGWHKQKAIIEKADSHDKDTQSKTFSRFHRQRVKRGDDIHCGMHEVSHSHLDIPQIQRFLVCYNNLLISNINENLKIGPSFFPFCIIC